MSGADPAAPVGRRRLLLLGAGAFAVALAPALFVRRRPLLHRRTLPVMGTIAEVALLHADAAEAQEALDAAFLELESVDRAMSRHRADSDIGRLNAAGARGPVAIAPQTALVLREALSWA